MDINPKNNASQQTAEQKPAEPAVNLPITLGKELLIEIVNLNQRIRTVFLGMEPGGFMLFKLYQNDLIGTFRSETFTKSPLIIRFQHEDTVYSFNSELLNIISNPCRLLFAAYPKKVEEYTVKPRERHECRLPTMAMIDNDIYEMDIIDIHTDGCLGVIKAAAARHDRLFKSIQVNKIIEIRTGFPGSSDMINLFCKIRNIAKDAASITVGMMFERVAPELRVKIEGFISREQDG